MPELRAPRERLNMLVEPEEARPFRTAPLRTVPFRVLLPRDVERLVRPTPERDDEKRDDPQRPRLGAR